MLTSQWLWCHVSIGARCGTPGHQQLPCWLHRDCDYDVMWVLAPDGRQDISNYHADSTVIMMSCEYWRQMDARTSATTMLPCWLHCDYDVIVRRAGLLWSQQDFEWRWSVPLFKCLTVLEFSFILFDLCLLITFFNFIMNYVPIVTFWIFTYHKIWILSIMFCSIWSYWIIYFLACL